MVSVTPASLKTVHVIGDSHALGFKGRSISLPEYGLIINTSVAYIGGLTADRLIDGKKLLPDLADYFLRQGMVTREGLPASATKDRRLILEQYATGSGYQRPLVIFTVGEIFIRKYLEVVVAQPQVNLSEVHEKFRVIVKKYLGDVLAIQNAVGVFPIVHEICPPTADDRAFEEINKFRCPCELRATVYGIFNQLLMELAFKSGICFCRSADYLSANGLLSEEFEFDGVHADPKFANTSLERAVSIWLHNRISDQSHRYARWVERIGYSGNQAPISRLGVSGVLHPFKEAEIVALRDALRQFDAAVCKVPPLDWGHLPPTSGYNGFNESITYGDISSGGLKILHDVLISGEAGDTIRSLLGARFSVINARPVRSSPHSNDGIGQQSMHRDGCPPCVFRALIYLSDVEEQDGPFEYMPVEPGSQPKRMVGHAGSMFVFDANAVAHRATPPRAGERLALDLILLAQPDTCAEIVDCRPGSTWPVDPYLFTVTEKCCPPLKANRWFYPALVVPKEAEQTANAPDPATMPPVQKAS